jgi:SAM-dependent methyltransferase
MSSSHQTSTGHVASHSTWLDAHFESARAEYEEGLRWIGVQPGWAVLDAGCGGGGFIPSLCEQAGPRGSVTALDLAPENVAAVDANARAGGYGGNLRTRVGSILELPFADGTFDCVWCANVWQYLTEAQSAQASAEFKRVLKPGGTLALKDADYEHVEIVPMDREVWARFLAIHKARSVAKGVLTAWGSGSALASRLRRAELRDIRRRGWMVERWAPLPPATRHFYQEYLVFLAGRAATYEELLADDAKVWRAFAANPGRLLDDPDACMREFFVVAVGRTAA